MSKRYTDYKSLDSCLSPITIYHGDRSYVLPCGKCDACRLAKANEWSMRLGSEISTSPFAIWFTLTYSNYYLPTLQRKFDGDKVVYYSDHTKNIRFDGSKDVSRVDNIEIVSGAQMNTPEVVNLYDESRLSYLSKRDIQLFYKLLRKRYYEYFEGIAGVCKNSIRYFTIGEYGSHTLRAHSHHIVFVDTKKEVDWLVTYGLFACWQMCDKALFDDYVRLTGDGVRNYVTNYVTSFTSLPQIYQCRPIRPFRLSSKSPSIGYRGFDEEKIFEDVLEGTIYYGRTVDRIEARYLLRYPKQFLCRFFPKCYRYSEKPYHLLLSVYGLLWTNVIQRGYNYDRCIARLRKHRNALDYFATKRCFDVCLKYNWHPFTFLWYVDRVYYLFDLDNLKKWYEWQEEKSRTEKPEQIILSYQNIAQYVREVSNSEISKNTLYNFLAGFGVDYDWFLVNYESFLDSLIDKRQRDSYRADLEDILFNMDKSNRLKELAKVSPTNNPLIY